LESSSEESTESSNNYRNHQRNHQPKTVDHQRTTYRSSRQRVVDPPPTSGQPSDPTSDPTNDPPNDPPRESSPRNRAIRVICRASCHRRACIERTAAIQASRRAAAGLVSNEPPRYKQAAGLPPGLCRTNRRDTSKPLGRRRVCVERTAAILAILQQPPGLHSESTIHLSGESDDS